MSPELDVLISPAREYAAYARADRRDGLWTAARRPLFVALLQGVAISMAATRSVAAPVVASVTVCWAMMVVAQVIGALLLIRSAPAPRVGASRAIDLFFLGYAPWSLWLLGFSGPIAYTSSVGLGWLALLTMIVPAALTARIVLAFSEHVLGMDRHQAVRRTFLHQGLMWAALIVFIATAIQLWPRVSGVFVR